MMALSSEHANQHIAREQCRVGDFVPVEYVPEWKDEMEPQEFRPRPYDISPIISGFGGSFPASGRPVWIFERQRNGAQERWVRVS